MFKYYFFNKKIYGRFLLELSKLKEKEKSVWMWHNENDYMQITFVYNRNIVRFFKEKNNSLKIEKINLPEKIDNNFYIPVEQLKKQILELKEEGSVVDSQHVIEFVNNHLKNTISYYHLTRKEVSQIYEEVNLENIEMFKNNPPATVVENMANKWID